MPEVYIRPNISYNASCAILCAAGSNLGNTMHGHHDFQLSDDVLHKVHIGHYTFYSKAIIKNPKLILRAPGVFSRKYLGGEGADDIIRISDAKEQSGTEGDAGHVCASQVAGYAKKDLNKDILFIITGKTISEVEGDTTVQPNYDAEFSGLLSGSQGISATNTREPKTQYYVRGTHYRKSVTGGVGVTVRSLNTLGFGENTYPGCKYAREGRGVALRGRETTVSSMI